MDQPNCSGSIALNVEIQARWEEAFNKQKRNALYLSNKQLEGLLEEYEHNSSFSDKILSKLGLVREPARIAAYKEVYETRKKLYGYL